LRIGMSNNATAIRGEVTSFRAGRGPGGSGRAGGMPEDGGIEPSKPRKGMAFRPAILHSCGLILRSRTVILAIRAPGF